MSDNDDFKVDPDDLVFEDDLDEKFGTLEEQIDKLQNEMPEGDHADDLPDDIATSEKAREEAAGVLNHLIHDTDCGDEACEQHREGLAETVANELGIDIDGTDDDNADADGGEEEEETDEDDDPDVEDPETPDDPEEEEEEMSNWAKFNS